MKPGTTFRPWDTRPAGHIFFIPPAERPDEDVKSRPHFLLHRSTPDPGRFALATLAHMTTKRTEGEQFGAPVHELRADGVARPDQEGFFVNGARLLPRDPRRLSRSAFVAADEVRAVRETVGSAIGIGEGVAVGDSRSIRGRLVRVAPRTARKAGFEYAFVLTQHAYSAQRRWQVLVPVIDMVVDGDDGPEELIPSDGDVVPEAAPWWKALPFEQPMIETAALTTLSEEWRKSRHSDRWLKRQIAVVTRHSIDLATLERVEAAIISRLHLPSP